MFASFADVPFMLNASNAKKNVNIVSFYLYLSYLTFLSSATFYNLLMLHLRENKTMTITLSEEGDYKNSHLKKSVQVFSQHKLIKLALETSV